MVSKSLLLCEGGNDVGFFRKFCKYLELNNIEIQKISGKSNFFKEESYTTIKQKVDRGLYSKVLFIVDADYPENDAKCGGLFNSKKCLIDIIDTYTVFVDLSVLNQKYQDKIIKYLKEHKTAFTPYLGINFCLADFEWIEIETLEKIKEDFSQIHSFTLKDDFEFESDNFGVKLTTANMACDVERGRIFKDFKEFIIEIGGDNSIKSKNRDNIYQINKDRVYFV